MNRDVRHAWAALDLGSNSFHLLIVQPHGASFIVHERLKEKVQLLGGFKDNCLAEDAQQRGLACLRRFAQRLAAIPAERLVVKGTYALRQAQNTHSFLQAAQEILRVPVQVISGDYEARLIYAAVTHHASTSNAPQLVLDIGGGSTELCFGFGPAVEAAASVDIGCVAFKDRHFSEVDQAQGFAAAKRAAKNALLQQLADSPISASQLRAASAGVFGTSGTVESIQTVSEANGWSRGCITLEAMQRLERAIVEDRWVLEAGLPGLPPDRADIFPAGAAILSACFEVLEIEQLTYVDVSLLQGIICEQLVIDTQRDVREDTVEQLRKRFAIDAEQARRVTTTALSIYDQCADWCGGGEEYRDLLRWAANLHEIGVHIAARHYHRHGAYVVKHTELPGFSEHQQSVLALLIRGHRRSMPGLAFRIFDTDEARILLRLVALLRIAVILERSHNDADSPQLRFRAADNRVELIFAQSWLSNHPLSMRELEVESQQQPVVNLELVFADAPAG
ncbi:MAG: Ppx/GppA phosphatase family protein [Pseudomonadales bacterium]|nr:Ppx/GppA phosphatase family protein [Pseudomonadales bacterium]